MVHVCTGEWGRQSRRPGGPAVGEAWLEPENHSAVHFWPEAVPRFTATLPHAPASVWEAVGLPGHALCRQEVGSTKDADAGSSAERVLGHYFLLVPRLLLTQQVPVRGGDRR